MQAQIQQTIVQATPDVDHVVQPGGTAISHSLTAGVSLDTEIDGTHDNSGVQLSKTYRWSVNLWKSEA